jgi:purine-binding chemotaxis protein CheW
MNDPKPMTESKARTFCTFRALDRLYGIEVGFVREVSTHVAVTPVPQAPPIIRGLANLRSRIFLMLDLRAALGLPTSTCTSESRMIVLQAHVMEQVGLLVDRGGEIIRVSQEQIEDSPAAAADPTGASGNGPSELVVGVCKLDNELMMIIDPARLVTATESALG